MCCSLQSNIIGTVLYIVTIIRLLQRPTSDDVDRQCCILSPHQRMLKSGDCGERSILHVLIKKVLL